MARKPDSGKRPPAISQAEQRHANRITHRNGDGTFKDPPHQGFKKAEQSVEAELERKNPRLSAASAKDQAGAILASSARRASKKAVENNPHLLNVRRKPEPETS